MDNIRIQSNKGLHNDVEVKFLVSRGKGSILFSPFYLLLTCFKIVCLKVVGRVDIVHINLSSYGSTTRKILIGKLCNSFNIPYSLHLHGSIYRKFWNNAGLKKSKKIESLFLNAAAIYVLGKAWEDYIVSKVPKAKRNVYILPNATPAFKRKRLLNPEGVIQILFLGALGKRKGVGDLIQALSLLPKNGSWRAVIAGDNEVEKYRKMVSEKGLDKYVQLPGWQDSDDVRELLEQSHIFVLPSYDENLPMSVIEAMSAGMAIVTTPVGATSDIIIDGETGFLVDPGDVESLYENIYNLVVNHSLRIELGRKAKEFHEKSLQIDVYFERLIELWHKIMIKKESL